LKTKFASQVIDNITVGKNKKLPFHKFVGQGSSPTRRCSTTPPTNNATKLLFGNTPDFAETEFSNHIFGILFETLFSIETKICGLLRFGAHCVVTVAIEIVVLEDAC
jgi:hypothetical protein